MLEVFRTLVDASGFIPHGHCYLWKAELVWLHVVSDSLTAIAYYSISFMLVYFVHKRRDVPFDWIFLMFGTFIVACGTTHLFEVWTLWHPIYWLSGFIKALTALVSVATAVLLVPLIPQALILPSPAQLEVINQALRNEITQRKLSEEALRRRKQEFKALVENTPDVIARYDRQLQHLYINPAIEQETQIPHQTFIGKTLSELGFPEEYVLFWESHFQKVFVTCETSWMEFDYPNLNGKDFYQARLVPEFAVDGSVESVLSIVRKITQLKQAEEALQRVNEQLEIRVQERTAELVLINESLQAEIETRKRTEEALHRREQEFKALVENAPDIIARLDRQLRHVYVNPAIELATGLSSEAFVGKTNRDLGMSEELVSYWESVIHKVFETGQQEVIEFHYPTPSGIKYYQSRIVPELAIDGSIEFTLSISRDITDVYEELRLRKQAEAALRESEQRFRAIFNQAAVGIAQVGLDGQWLLVNQKLGDIVGYSYEELLERRFQDITHPDDLDADIEYVRQMLAGEIQTYSREKRYIHKNGYYIWINLIVSLVCNLSDEPQYFISVVEDISDRRRTEEEIRLLQTITQAITEAPDFEGALEIALCKVCETTGWNFGEAWMPHPRENILELSPAWYSSTESLNQFRRENEAFTFPLNTGLPGRVWASKQPEWIPDISIQPEAVFLRSRMAQHSGLNVALGIPIIARESEVSGQESQVLAIFVFFTFESRQEDKRLVEIVSSVANQLGLVIQRKRTEAELQKSLKDLSDIKFALDQSAIVAITDARGVITYVNDKFCEISHYSREELIGKTHRIINSGYHPKEFFKDLWSTISTGKVWQGEINNRAKDGSYYWVDTAIVPFLDDQGKPFQYLAIRFDISERKRAEQEIKELNQNLERRVAERTAELEAANQELEAFSYSVSHDLRAPLRGVDGFSQTLLDRYNDTLDDRGKHYLQRIRAGTQRMGELIDDLLKLSRVTRSEMQRTQVDLSALAREIAAELQRTQPERQVEWAIAPGIFAHGDVQLLRIVLENLLNNSWKFTSLRIQTRIELGIIPQADAKVAYFVRDNGVGFDMAYANKLFGAFQRLHSQAQFPGTGIGLATVQRIIHRHGGRVWAQGAVEQGASFYFTLHQSQELR